MGFVNFFVVALLLGGFILLLVNDYLPSKIGRWKGTDDDSRDSYSRNRYSHY